MFRIIFSCVFSFIFLKGLSVVFPQIIVGDFLPFALFLIVLSLVNNFIKPVLQFFSFPISLLTLGLFGWLINFLCFWLAVDAVGVIKVNASGVLWFVSMLLISLTLSVSTKLFETF